MKDKLLKTMLLLLLPLAFTGEALGQLKPYGFAGEDKTVVYDCTQPYTLVSLGEQCPQTDEQYYWEVFSTEGEGVFAAFEWDSQNAPLAVARIHADDGIGSVRFCCSRVSQYGYQKECVTVTLTNKFAMYATPKQNCWADGDYITIDQFDIETVPPGNDCYVALDENSLKAKNEAGNMYETQEVHFVSNDANHPMEELGSSARILVIRSNDDLGVQIPPPTDLKKKLDAYNSGIGIKEKLRRVEKLTEPLKKFGPIDFSPNVTPNVNITNGRECCNGAESRYIKIAGDITASVTFSLSVPHPAFPYLQFFIAFTGSFAANFPEVKFTYTTGDVGCSEIAEVPYSFTGELEGGVALAAGGRDFLSVSASILGGMNCPGLFHLTYAPGNPPEIKFLSATFYGKVKLQAVTPLGVFSTGATFAETSVGDN